MITYGNTKPWITAHFNLYKLNRCTPAAEHTNDDSSKQISQKMHSRDIFSIFYYFIISQFPTVRPSQSPPGVILLPHVALRQHSFTCSSIYIFLCILLPAVVLQPGYSLRQNKLRMPSSDFKKNHFSCSSLQNRCRRSCLWNSGCYNTTT